MLCLLSLGFTQEDANPDNLAAMAGTTYGLEVTWTVSPTSCDVIGYRISYYLTGDISTRASSKFNCGITGTISHFVNTTITWIYIVPNQFVMSHLLKALYRYITTPVIRFRIANTQYTPLIFSPRGAFQPGTVLETFKMLNKSQWLSHPTRCPFTSRVDTSIVDKIYCSGQKCRARDWTYYLCISCKVYLKMYVSKFGVFKMCVFKFSL